MSFTESGLTCPACYLKWEIGQREQALADERAAANAVHVAYRWRLAAGAAIALIIVLVSNWHCSR
jgi:hypothetical protein